MRVVIAPLVLLVVDLLDAAARLLNAAASRLDRLLL